MSFLMCTSFWLTLKLFCIYRLESRVKAMLKKAYWDAFDESLTSKRPNQKQALSVFREIKNVSWSMFYFIDMSSI
jgi:hypothetical protein